METIIQTEKSYLKYGLFDNSILLEDCVNEIKGKLIIRPPIILYGKTVNQNRNIGFFSNESIGYKYSNQIMGSQPLSNNLLKLLEFINTKFNSNFNGILVNQYMNGNNSIGAHSDDETKLDKSGVIAISYGANRKFRIRNKFTKKIEKDIIMEHNSILHMGGKFQKEFTHEIPIEKKVKEPRISFTFRKHLE
jgi:alkylated DNA repair dioxygenase AlkB